MILLLILATVFLREWALFTGRDPVVRCKLRAYLQGWQSNYVALSRLRKGDRPYRIAGTINTQSAGLSEDLYPASYM